MKNVLPIFDPTIILDTENVPSESGSLYEDWERVRYGGPPKRVELKKAFVRFDRDNHQRNKEFFMTRREKQDNEDEFLKQYGVNS